MLLPIAVSPETSTRLTAVWKGEPARSVKHSVKCLGRERFSREAVLCNVPLSAEMLSVLTQMTAQMELLLLCNWAYGPVRQTKAFSDLICSRF